MYGSTNDSTSISHNNDKKFINKNNYNTNTKLELFTSSNIIIMILGPMVIVMIILLFVSSNLCFHRDVLNFAEDNNNIIINYNNKSQQHQLQLQHQLPRSLSLPQFIVIRLDTNSDGSDNSQYHYHDIDEVVIDFTSTTFISQISTNLTFELTISGGWSNSFLIENLASFCLSESD